MAVWAADISGVGIETETGAGGGDSKHKHQRRFPPGGGQAKKIKAADWSTGKKKGQCSAGKHMYFQKNHRWEEGELAQDLQKSDSERILFVNSNYTARLRQE